MVRKKGMTGTRVYWKNGGSKVYDNMRYHSTKSGLHLYYMDGVGKGHKADKKISWSRLRDKSQGKVFEAVYNDEKY